MLNELIIPDAGGFHSFLPMTPDQFRQLLEYGEPQTERSDTIMRRSITSDEMVVLTLRYIASGIPPSCITGGDL